ncbi:hypothetical protein D3C86_1595160 [compost metagenome]
MEQLHILEGKKYLRHHLFEQVKRLLMCALVAQREHFLQNVRYRQPRHYTADTQRNQFEHIQSSPAFKKPDFPAGFFDNAFKLRRAKRLFEFQVFEIRVFGH